MRPERKADHLPPSNAEVKNAWNYTPLPQQALMRGTQFKKKA